MSCVWNTISTSLQMSKKEIEREKLKQKIQGQSLDDFELEYKNGKYVGHIKEKRISVSVKGSELLDLISILDEKKI